MDRPGLDVEIGATLERLARRLAEAEARATKTAKKIEGEFRKQNTRAAATFDRIDASMNRSMQGLGRLQTALLGALSVRAVQAYADAWTVAGNKIAAASEVADRSGRSLSGIRQIADDTRSGLSETADLYAKLLRATKDVAKSEEEVAAATELVNKAFKAGGAAVSEQAAGILQLAQGLSSGILQGDELRSLRENAPILAQAIADEFGVTIGQLKDLGAAGELTADRVFQAILKAQPQIEKAFAATNATIGEGFVRLRNALTEYIGAADDSLGATQLIVSALEALAKNLDAVALAGTVLAGRVLGPMLAGAATKAATALASIGTSASVAAGGLAAVRAGIGLLGGPVGALIVAMTALPMVVRDTQDGIDATVAASDEAGAALDRYAAASERAAAEQEQLGGKISATTQQLLAQSRVELQNSLQKLKTELGGLTDDLFGRGLFDVDDLQKAIDQIATAQKVFLQGGNDFLDNIRQGLGAIRDGGGDLTAVLEEIQRLSGAGREVLDVVERFDGARLNLETVDLEGARAELVAMAEAIGGFEAALADVENAKGPAEAEAAYSRLRDLLVEASQAGEVLRKRLDADFIDVLKTIGATERQIQALEAALAGNIDEARRLAGELDKPAAGVTKTADAAEGARAKLEDMLTLLEDIVAFTDANDLGSAEMDATAAAAVALATEIRAALQGVRDLDAAKLDNLAAAVGRVKDSFTGLLDGLGLVFDRLSEWTMPEDLGRVISGLESASDGRAAAASLLRQFEGFRATPYRDVNALRVGYGSDTITLADGTIQKVTDGMRVSVEDANRDLNRRIVEFQQGVIAAVGAERFASFTPAQQGALTSIAYNYGSLGRGGANIADTVRTGSNADIVRAIQGLAGDNNGINRTRRMTEASIFAGGVGVETTARRSEDEDRRRAAEAAREAQRAFEAQTEAMREQQRVRQQFVDGAADEQARRELEIELIGKSAAEQARLITRFELLQKLKREGIDVNERLAGSEQTYGQLIEQTANAAAQAAAQEERLTAERDRAGAAQEFLAAQQQTFKDGLLDAIVAGRDFTEVLQQIAQALARAALEAALFGEGPFAGGGDGGGLLGGLVSGLLGKRAGGGPVQAGQPYLVNENTANSEIFVPSRSGGILNVRQAQEALAGAAGGGAVRVTYAPVIDARGADAAAIARLENQMRAMNADFEARVHTTMRNARNRRTDSWR